LLAELTLSDTAKTLQVSTHATAMVAFRFACSICMIVIVPIGRGLVLFRNAQCQQQGSCA
jgi:hypothetical protein